jgi:flagellar capping protein FliD
MAGIALSGLASGVDTSTIVSQLMQLERQGTTRTQYRQANINQQRPTSRRSRPSWRR